MIKVGIDIGNSKISCIVCDIKNFKNPKVLSFVSLPTSNINKGNIIFIPRINSEGIKKTRHYICLNNSFGLFSQKTTI